MLVTILILSIVLLDQISKYYAVLFLKDSASYLFLPNLLSFQYHENRGAAWGLFADQRWIFMSVSTIAILLILAFFLYCWWKKEKISSLLSLSLACFCGGGIGNMIDRFILGYVVDFLKFEFIEFPIFNVADSFICVGAGLMILYLFSETLREYKEKLQKKDIKND